MYEKGSKSSRCIAFGRSVRPSAGGPGSRENGAAAPSVRDVNGLADVAAGNADIGEHAVIQPVEAFWPLDKEY